MGGVDWVIRITSLIDKGFEYHVLPQGLQMLDNVLAVKLEGIEEEVSIRLSFSFQSREWTIEKVIDPSVPINQIFDYQPELLAEGLRLITRIDEMNDMDEEEFEAACERGEFKDISGLAK
jgi:hypothetical protein